MLVVGAVGFFYYFGETKDGAFKAHQSISQPEIFARFAGSKTCAECHKDAYNKWTNSHHGLAERVLLSSDPVADLKVSVNRVVGVHPLRQFLVPTNNGRLQATELAFDPVKHEWFNIFGEENRQPGEWGHWTGRGMNWNSMCATCHNTRLRKNYDATTDSYKTAAAEMSVSCESCHGPMATHVQWQRKTPGKNDPTIRRLSKTQMLSACAACHTRRTELDGEFEAGADFFDHFGLTIPDESDLYYPDGQVRDENYEVVSFMSSRMHAAGVSCNDCHEPHSSKPILQGNDLCMRCHTGTTQPPAPRIEPLAHSHHKLGSTGNSCVACHMPTTVYMQRHPRHDHGFTIPDPQLTKETGTPNACNRCHTEKSTDWAIEHTEAWYGEKMNRPSHTRARHVASARKGDTNIIASLIEMSRAEPLPVWRGVGTVLLERFAEHPAAQVTLAEKTKDPSPLVRAQAVRGLSALLPMPSAQENLRSLLSDPSRSVRVAAAWALHHEIDTNSTAGKELLASLNFNTDQPLGAMQHGTFYLDRNDPHRALSWFEKSVAWDPKSAPFRQALAIASSTLNRHNDAIEQLRAACQLAPKEAHYRYSLGLAYNEAGRQREAIAALEEAVKLDDSHALAWYNLGLGYSALSDDERALAALAKAEILDQQSARVPYARATILIRRGQTAHARSALSRVLELQPGFAPAHELMRSLGPE